MMCPTHQKEMKFNQRFGWSCPTPIEKSPNGDVIKWCDYKPNKPQGSQGTKPVPQTDKMSKADWEEKDQQKRKDILLQVAFKAAVELVAAGKTQQGQSVFDIALEFNKWLLSQTEGQKETYEPNVPFGNEDPTDFMSSAYQEEQELYK